mmetsp:Transcript_43563/g.98279  ORF Transcript_43563/g.98279 Transcript_43563/m.98279 type:complete len:227 (+) Transcript_43563:281-961(+)
MMEKNPKVMQRRPASLGARLPKSSSRRAPKPTRLPVLPPKTLLTMFPPSSRPMGSKFRAVMTMPMMPPMMTGLAGKARLTGSWKGSGWSDTEVWPSNGFKNTLRNNGRSWKLTLTILSGSGPSVKPYARIAADTMKPVRLAAVDIATTDSSLGTVPSRRVIAPKQPMDGKGHTGMKKGGVSSTSYLAAAARRATSCEMTTARIATAVGMVFAATLKTESRSMLFIC